MVGPIGKDQFVGPGTTINDVIASPGLDHVITGTAQQAVIACPADQRVGTIAPCKQVITITAIKNVIAGATLQCIRAVTARQHIIAIAAIQHVITSATLQAIRPVAALKVIIPVTTIEHIIPGTAGQCVIASTPLQGIIAGAAFQAVIARATVKRVVASATLQGVVARTAQNVVIAIASINEIVTIRPGNGIIPGGAHHIFEAGNRIRTGVVPNGDARPEINTGLPGPGHIKGIVACTARKRVIPGTGQHGIVAGPGIDHIIASTAIDHIIARQAGKAVGPGITGQRVVPAGARNIFNPANLVGSGRIRRRRPGSKIHRGTIGYSHIKAICPGPAGKGIVASTGDKGIIPGTAIDHIIAGTAIQRVITVAAQQGIVPGIPPQGIVAGPTIKGDITIGILPAGQVNNVIAIACVNHLDIAERRVRRAIGVVLIQNNGIIARCAQKGIVTGTAIKAVIAQALAIKVGNGTGSGLPRAAGMVDLIALLALAVCTKLQHIIAIPARQRIGSVATAQGVGIITAIQHVIARATIQRIIPVTTGNGVVTAPGSNRVIATNGVNIIIAIGTVQGVIAWRSAILDPVKLVRTKLIQGHTLQGDGTALRQGNHRIAGIIAAQKRLQFAPGRQTTIWQGNNIFIRRKVGNDVLVGAILENKRVITGPAGDHIITGTAVDHIIAGTAQNAVIARTTGQAIVARAAIKGVGPGIARNLVGICGPGNIFKPADLIRPGLVAIGRSCGQVNRYTALGI